MKTWFACKVCGKAVEEKELKKHLLDEHAPQNFFDLGWSADW